MSNPILSVWVEMTKLGYEEEEFDSWNKRVQLFFGTQSGGIAFLSDPIEPKIWWLNAYCPNERPDNNTVRFLIALAFASGCHVLRSEVKRTGSAKMLERLNFRQVNENLYEYRP